MSANGFLTAVQSHDWFTENGAVSHSTTGDALLDYFSKSGTYSGREPIEVAADLSRAWADSPQMTLMTVFYNRMISRSPNGFADIGSVQSGQGMRDEFRKALGWMHVAHPDVLYANLWLVPVVGTWKDLWHADTVETLDAQQVYQLVERGLGDDYNRPLIAKYLPRIRSKSKIKNPHHLALNKWARGLCEHLGWTEREYRRFKSNPANEAHLWQRCMCAGQWDQINFDAIPGKAMFKLNNNTGEDGVGALERHAKAEVTEWAQSADTIKFTGHVYDLVKASKNARFLQRTVIDKQFDGLIELAQKDREGLTENIWCALDTSGSMGMEAVAGTSAFDICVGMGVYFSTLNTGAFHNQVIMFDEISRTLSINGSFTDKVQQINASTTAWGSTNFQSVIDEIVRVRSQNPDIPVEDFPTTLLVVSDMQFNPSQPTGSHSYFGNNPDASVDVSAAETNHETAMRKLADAGLPPMRVIWWNVNARGTDFPSKFDDAGTIMISGFDGSIISLLLGGEPPANPEAVEEDIDPIVGDGPLPMTATPVDAMLKALDQPVLQLLEASV